MKFEIGKFYEHTSGKKLSVIGELPTTMWDWGGPTLIAESNWTLGLMPLGRDEAATENYHEITKERWMESFGEDGKKDVVKHRLELEVNTWATSPGVAFREAAHHLRGIGERLGTFPATVVEGELPTGGMTGEPFGPGKKGWKGRWSFGEHPEPPVDPLLRWRNDHAEELAPLWGQYAAFEPDGGLVVSGPDFEAVCRRLQDTYENGYRGTLVFDVIPAIPAAALASRFLLEDGHAVAFIKQRPRVAELLLRIARELQDRGFTKRPVISADDDDDDVRLWVTVAPGENLEASEGAFDNLKEQEWWLDHGEAVGLALGPHEKPTGQ